MYVKIHIDELMNDNLCQESLDFFYQMTGGNDTFETEDWTDLHEISMQQLAPDFVAWLRFRRMVPFPNFSTKDLSGLSLVNADLRGADLSYANLNGVDFSGAKLQRTNLIGTDLTQAVLDNGTDLTKAYYDGPPIPGWVANEFMVLSRE